MPYSTLWESICRLSNEDKPTMSLDDAVKGSAVPRSVAVVEIRRMAEDGLLEVDGDVIELTERGRAACQEIYHVPGISRSTDSELD